MPNEIKPSADYSDFVDEYNALIHIINSVVNKVKTLELVRVLSVNTSDNTLSVIPIIRNANANGDAIEETPVYGVKYLEWQYGTNSIISVPAVGDIGMCLISHKDISNVESGLVGSFRRFCESDSIYLGGIKGLNQTPTQFIEFSSSGINITSPADLTINAQSATINATEVNLGGEVGAVGVALVGCTVTTDGTMEGTVVGKIAEGSSIVKAIKGGA